MIRAALGRSARFSAQPLAAGNAFDLWSGAARDPSPAYLWLRCNDRPVSTPRFILSTETCLHA